MDLIKESFLFFLLKLAIILSIFFILINVFKYLNYKISKEKIASLVLLLLFLYYVFSIILGIFFDIDI
ncbi:hypothetical protein FLAT13_05058 [Flavobacterium salmonis]|uniref:Uncharacterized protein n=1 Tax=Flavobacterium salmonis TaxID=2654844 RepID=A0A6V6ZD09_9FLAO|nr:hypothetical protein FLAT13_05058 [Flavobacterium salmonis]